MIELPKNSKQIKKAILLLIFVCLFGAIFLIHSKARLYGDDWFYHTFSQVDFSYYIQRNIEHYFRANGRVIVHLLATLFLKLPVISWGIINTLFLVAMSWMMVSISSKHNKENIDKYIFGALIMAFFISTMEGNIISQSLYWLTGSFNYVYPLFMLILLIFNYYKQEEKPNWKLYSIGFLAGASVEQAGMMAFGFLLLNMLHKHFILKEKVKKEEFILVSITLLGLLTVLLAPATFLRASIEAQDSKPLIELIKYNIQIQGTTFLFSRIMVPTNILTVLAAYVAIKLRIRQQSRLKPVEVFIISFASISVIGLVYQLISRFAYIQYHIFEWQQFTFFGIIGLGYLVLLCYSTYVVYLYSDLKYKALPAILLVIGLGSAVVMLFLPVFGYRNLIFALFALALYSLLLIQMHMKYELLLLIFGVYHMIHFRPLYGLLLMGVFIFVELINAFYKTLGKTTLYKEIAIIGLVGLLISRSFYSTYQGYTENAYLYDKNLAKARTYINNNEGNLEQKKLPNDVYRWSMPYENDYYKPYYNLYIGVDGNQAIDWID